MPQTIPNNRRTDELAPVEIARELARRKQLTPNRQKTGSPKEPSEHSKQLEKNASNPSASEAERLAAAQELSRLQLEEEADQPRDLSQFQTQWPEEGTEASTVEAEKKPPEIGHVPMDQQNEPGTGAAAPTDDLGQPVAEKPSTEGGGQIPSEQDYFGQTKPAGEEGQEAPTAGGQPQKPDTETPSGKATPDQAGPAESTPSESDQAAAIGNDRMAKMNQGLTSGAKGAEDAIAGKLGETSEMAGKAFSAYKKYKWIIWIGGIIIANIWWIIAGIIIIALFIVAFFAINYMVNNPGTTFFNAMWCGRPGFLGGGDFYQCLMKKAVETATEAVTKP